MQNVGSSSKVSFRVLNIGFVLLLAGSLALAGNWKQVREFFSSSAGISASAVTADQSPGIQTPHVDAFIPTVTDTVCGAGTYPTLKAAFDAINAGTLTGAVQLDVVGDCTETATAVLNASGSGSASYTAVLIQPTGGAARTISGAITAGSPLIDLNGADNVTIDGLNSGGNSLTISNTTISATSGTSTIRFIGGATGNTITNSNIEGSGTMSVATNGATIFFSTDAVTSNGNDNNTISNNNIGPAGGNLPTKGILCNGSTTTTALGNSGNVVDNNNIFDFFGAAVTSSGIASNGGCNSWSITNNRFYQTAPRTWTTGALHVGIDIRPTTSTSGAQGFTITGNTIGYASNTQTGTYTLTGTGTGAKFIGILFNGISTGASTTVSNNTVAAVSLTGVTSSGTSTSTPFAGIFFQEGNGITNGNTIGSQSATGSLTYSTTTTSSTDVYGIYNFSSNAWTANSNNVGGISVTNLGASGTFLLYGMRAFTASTTTWSATSNNVGGTVADSIQLSATGTSSQVVGMFSSNCPMALTSNTIRNLTNNIGTGTTTAASVIGISATSTTPNHTFSQNTIYNLTNTNASAASVVTGIQFTGSTANVVERNLIYGLSVATNSTSAEVNGIRIAGGTTNFRNNMIAIGAGIANAIGAAATNSGTSGINGVNEALGTNTFYHNSVYIGGAPTAGTGASYAFNGTQTVNTRTFRDNIFFNGRSNSGATGSNYAVKINGTAPNPTGLTINNNIYFANGSGAVFGFFNGADVANLAAWKTAVGQDSNSFESNPQFVDPTNATPNLHLNPAASTVAEGNGADVGVVNDFDGETRASLTPVDIGADAGNYMGLDLAPPNISYATLNNTSQTSNRLLTATISDATGVAGGGLSPRVYFNKNAGTYFSTTCTLSSGTNQNGTWDCTIDHSLIGGVLATDVVRYFVVAQDTLGNLAANPGAGFTGTDVNTVLTPPTTPNQYTIVTAYSGSLNVGTGEAFTSLTNVGGVFEAINNGVLSGDVTINITSDLTGETGSVALNQWVEEGGPYSLLIKPSGGPRVISGTNTGALMKFNGTDRMTLNGSTSATLAGNLGGGPVARELTIQNTSTGTSAVVIALQSGTGGAQNNSFVNLEIMGQDPTTTLAAIALGGNTPGTAGTDNDNNSVANCAIKRAIYGIYSAGASLANQNTGTYISQNDLSATGADRVRRIGIFVVNDNGAVISQNSISTNTNESADAIGIALGIQGIDSTTTTSGSVTNAVVSRNKINGVASLSTTGFSACGISVSGAVGGANTIVNNMITGVTAPSTSPDLPAGIFIAGVAGSSTKLYNNSIAMTGDRGAVASQMPSYGIAITGSDPTVEMKNNAIYTSQIASGGGANAKSYAVGMVTATFANLDSNYNGFFSTGANDGGFRSGSLGAGSGTEYADLAAWQTAVSDDANSLEADPLFVDSLTDLHLQSGSPLENAGTTIAGVTDDFDGDLRQSPPEIGADEFGDTIPPDTSILTFPSNPSNSTDPSFTFDGSDNGGSGVASFECQIDAGGFSACTSPKSYTGLSQGSHTFDVRAIDGAGNIDATPASHTWVIDSIPPETQILSNPSDPSNSADAAFTFTATDLAASLSLTFECDLDNGGYASCSSPKNYTGLSDGSHTFSVRATDGAGNTDPTPATYTWTINTAPAGPVTVTATAATPTGSYNTLTEAVAAINGGTHQGDVIVNINQSTVEPGSVVINGSGAGSASYSSILIRPTANGLTVSGATVQGRGLIELNGADNVTIDGDNPNSLNELGNPINRDLTLQNTAANTVTFTSVVRVAVAATGTNSADNNSIKNLNIVGNATGRNISTATSTTATENTTFGIFAGPGASTTDGTVAPTAVTSVSTGVGAGATAANLFVSNNSVVTVARAISINGSATTVFPGLKVFSNSIGNPTAGDADQVYAIGITAQGSTDAIIADNIVYLEGYIASSAANHGINVGVNSTAVTGATIERNKINRVQNNNGQSWSAFGINLGGGSSHIVRNNFVSGVINSQVAGTGGFSTTFGAFGIRVASGTGHTVYHNSVNLYGAMPGVTNLDLTAAFGITSTTLTGVDVRNNMFSNQISGGNPTGTRHVAVYLPTGATSAMNLTWNNNGYFGSADPQSRLAQRGTTFGTGEFLVGDFDPTQTTPATNFRNYTSTLSVAGTNDDASFATNTAPPVTSNSDLHIPNATPTRLESGGASVGVGFDIDGDSRNGTTPDIGADEFNGAPPPANDIAAVTLLNPANGSTIPTGSFSPQARFSNPGTATQTSVPVRFRIYDGMMVEIYNQTASIPSIAANQNVDVTFPSANIAGAGSFTMTATAENPGDTNASNDNVNGSFNTVVPLGGSINVGAGEAYTSLTNPGGVFEALNLAGISGDLTVNITSDLTAETGAVMLNQLVESGAGGYTVTFRPSGAARTISGSSASSAALISLNGADRIVFDGSLNALGGGNDRSLTIINNQTTTTTVFWLRSQNASNGSTNNTIKNCIIHGAPGPNSTTTAGILTGSGTTLGADAEAANSNNTIHNNWIYGVQNSLYLRGGATAPVFDQNWTVTGNELGSSNVNDNNVFRGMLIGNSANFTVSGNTVHGVRSTTTTTAAMSGIQLGLLLSNGTVTNNVVSNIKNVSATGTGAAGISIIATSTSSNVTIANNFVTDIATNGFATVASNGHGISFTSTTGGSGYNVYFNSVNLATDQVSAQTSAALFVASTFSTSGAIDLRNNVLANTETTGTRYAVYSAAPASVFSTINYNDYFAPTVGNIGGSDRVTLGDWQTATGQDANSLAADPLFVSASDLHLQAGSPAINAGTAVSVTTDIDGDTRDASPDMGADEYIAPPNPGTLQFSNPTYSGGEGDGPFTVTVTRTGGSFGTVSVDYATSNGTATGGAGCTAGVDYISTSGTLTFLDGETSKTFNVTICDDATFEGDETINYALTNPTGGATLGTPNTAVQTIVDNDTPPQTYTVAVSDVRIHEGNTGTAFATFNVTLSATVMTSNIGGPIASVQYATADGTATAGVDYGAVSGTLNFNAPGTQTVSVPVFGETIKEANETFYLNLSNPSPFTTITDSQGVGIIIDEDRAYTADFDRDLKTDYSVFRPSEGNWYVLKSASVTPNIVNFGVSGDVAVPGDYDGDGLADIAVWRASEGNWYVIRSTDSSIHVFHWGTVGDTAVQGDYDGDGKTDYAIFRPSTGDWWISYAAGGSLTTHFGISTDRPVQGDYDGDAKTDIAVYRDGTWYVLKSSTVTLQVANWGISTDKPVPSDFDGDGKFDFAVYRDGSWWIQSSLTGGYSIVALGDATDIPAAGDFDGDGTSDPAVFRPSNGDWYVIPSSTSALTGVHWGTNGDVPVPSAYLPQ